MIQECQQTDQLQSQNQPSSYTATNSGETSSVVPTREHRRFTEFCDACRRYGYIGLCYGVSGVGKTLSARTYSRWDEVLAANRWSRGPVDDALALNTVFYTPSVINTPSSIDSGIRGAREKLRNLSSRPLQLEKSERLASIRERDQRQKTAFVDNQDWLRGSLPELSPTFGEIAEECSERERRFSDPTSLILVDEADWLRIASLEQIRSIFDAGKIGLIFIGMPGLEKRLARYPQLYSRIGFVHEFRPLGAAEMRQLLDQRWPSGLKLPAPPWAEDAVVAIIRISSGNFRLLNRLLTQMERILEINGLAEVTKTVVEAARETLVIGSA